MGIGLWREVMRLVYFLFCKLLILVLCSLFFWDTFIDVEELFMYYTLEPFLTNAIFVFVIYLWHVKGLEW